MRRLARRRAGFSLVELMVVLGLTSLLFVLITKPLMRAKSETQLQSCVENLKNMGVAYQSYMADHPGIKDVSAPNMWTCLIPQYLTKVPTCPSSGESTLRSVGGGLMAGYVWVNYYYVDSEPYPYVMCLGAHNDVLPASRGPWLGPVWSPRSGADDCRSGSPRY